MSRGHPHFSKKWLIFPLLALLLALGIAAGVWYGQTFTRLDPVDPAEVTRVVIHPPGIPAETEDGVEITDRGKIETLISELNALRFRRSPSRFDGFGTLSGGSYYRFRFFSGETELAEHIIYVDGSIFLFDEKEGRRRYLSTKGEFPLDLARILG